MQQDSALARASALRAALALLLFAGLALTGCRSVQPDGEPGADSAWVAQTFSGGVQCDPESDYEPPDTRALLEDAGVRVREVATEQLEITSVCGASAYAAIHYALIDAGDVEAALGVGFEPSEAPPDWAQR